MSAITVVVLVFSVIGALDYLFGSKLGVGKEFEKAFRLFAPMSLSMIGMIVIAPAVGVWLSPFFETFYNAFGIDPSIIPASLFANDMGGVQLGLSVYKSEEMGRYNAFVISSMMGCMISFNIPFSLGLVKEEQHKDLFLGFLCGIVTIPIGCFIAGLICKLKVVELLVNLLPLIIIAAIVGLALVFIPKICIKCFAVFGFIIKVLAVVGLICAIFTFLSKREISPHFDSLENAAFICVNACITLSGALPFMFVVSKLLKKPLNKIGEKLSINGVSTLAFLGSMVTNASTFGIMDKMDRKGVVLNSAFAVSASFVFGSHIAFTMAFDESYVVPVVTGKLISGVCAVVLALLIYKEDTGKAAKTI